MKTQETPSSLSASIQVLKQEEPKAEKYEFCRTCLYRNEQFQCDNCEDGDLYEEDEDFAEDDDEIEEMSRDDFFNSFREAA